MKIIYVIKDNTAASHNGVKKEYIDAKGNGTSLLENAKWYYSNNEAQEVIDDNNWNSWAYVSKEEIPTYRIAKTYTEYPSKNKPNYQSGLTLEEAIQYLDGTERNWKHNGGIIVDRTDDSLIVEESTGDEIITFEIMEEIF